MKITVLQATCILAGLIFAAVCAFISERPECKECQERATVTANDWSQWDQIHNGELHLTGCHCDTCCYTLEMASK